MKLALHVMQSQKIVKTEGRLKGPAKGGRHK